MAVRSGIPEPRQPLATQMLADAVERGTEAVRKGKQPMSENAAIITRPPQERGTEYHMPADSRVNVGDLERTLSVLGGGALALYGLRHALPHLMLLLGGSALIYRGLTGHCPVYQAMEVDTASQHPEHGITLEATITVNKPAAVVYRFWRHLENHPRFMRHLESVVSTGEKRSHWMAQGPLHVPFTWDAELVEECENVLLSWRSLPGGDVDTTETVHLRELPNGRGTEVRFQLTYAPPAGVAGVALAKLFKTLTVRQLKEELRRFKHIVEMSETPMVANQPAVPPLTWKTP